MSRRYSVDALEFSCPTCGARVGYLCKDRSGRPCEPHGRRLAKMPNPRPGKGSVHAIPSAIETNRRRH